MEIINKIEFESNLWVGEVLPIFNTSQENRYLVSNIGAISKGKFQSNNPEVRFNHFLTESGGEPSVPLEFIPVKINSNLAEKLSKLNADYFHNKVLRYSYVTWTEDGMDWVLHTNLRTLFKAGIRLEDTPFNTLDEVKDFKIIVGKLPYFIWMHLRTHRSFSFMIETCRKSIMQEEYYITEDPHYKDKPELLRLRLGVFAAWKQDSNSWDNLLKVRIDKKTQIDTKKVVNNIKKLIL